MSKRTQGIVSLILLTCIAVFYSIQIWNSPSPTPFLHADQRTHTLIFNPKTPDETIALYTEVLAWFTGILAISTLLLWWTTRSAAIAQARDMKMTIDVSERTLISSRRAFVFAGNLDSQWIREEVDDGDDRYHWRLRVVWLNSGETPTKRLRQTSDCVVRDHPLAENESLADGPLPPGTGLLGPKASSMGGQTPQPPGSALSPETLAAAIRGEKFIYISGWIRYFDVFPGTPEHVTKFCWRVIPVGNPFEFEPGHGLHGPHSLRFDYIHMTKGNCADEECET